MESLSEACSLRAQMVGEAAQQLCDALLALPPGDWNKDRVIAVLSETVEAFPKEERMDPLSALRAQKAALESMARSDVPMRYGDMLRCQKIAERLKKEKANEAAATRFLAHVRKFNKVKKAAKLKVGALVGLPKAKLSWMDDEKNVSHMSERDMEAFPDRFEEMVAEMGEDAEVLALSLGSRKSLEDFVKVVLLQPVLKDVELDQDPERPLYGLGGAEHSEFLEALKTALLVQMKAAGKKIQL